MSIEMEALWQGMKSSHYKRTAETLADKIRETDDMKEALPIALGIVVSSMKAETGTLWFYEKGGSGRIYPRAVYDGADLSGISLRPGEGIAGQVIEGGTPVIVKDCQKDPRWAGRVDSKTGFQTKSMVCVPMTARGVTFGCIQIINMTNGQLFDEKELEFAKQLAAELVRLLGEQGLLPEYVTSIKEGITEEEDLPSFRDIVLRGNMKEMEKILYTMPEFAHLGARKQMETVKLCHQLRECFGVMR